MSAPEKINRTNYMKYNPDGDDGQHVKAGFWNNLVTWLLAMFPSLGSANIDTVSEYTSGSGITLDGLTVKDGKSGATTALTANATGIGAAIISSYEQHVVITSTNVNHIAALPLLSSVPTGTRITGSLVNTGCELRPHLTDRVTAVTVNNVSATGGTEIALDNSTAGAYFEAIKLKSTAWIVKAYSKTGAYRASVPN